jgi:hypothetical protein
MFSPRRQLWLWLSEALGLLLLLLSVHLAQALTVATGATTAFNAGNALDIAAYCNGADALDDTACMTTWIGAAEAQGKHLYASAGTYYYTDGIAVFPGFHLQCASPAATIFKALSLTANDLFVLLPNFVDEGASPWTDMLVENCGFDLNGVTSNFTSVIAFGGGVQRMANVTVRGNHVWDSTLRGTMLTSSTSQRQYIVVTVADNVLVEDNVLSEGGRIKVGRPGNTFTIRRNRIYSVNDNGITVVDTAGGTTTNILIENNEIVNPIRSGIFFGADGQTEGDSSMVLSDVVVRYNKVRGTYITNCITGVLPNNATRISITDNVCHKTGAYVASTFPGGIGLNRNNTGVTPVTNLTIARNSVTSDVPNALNALAGIFLAGPSTAACIVNNHVSNTATAIYIRDTALNTIAMCNDIGTGIVRLNTGGTVNAAGDPTTCFVPTFN